MLEFEKISFLVQPSLDPKHGYTAVAMQPGEFGHGLTPTQPRHIGAGQTPVAALLRAITPLREKYHTYEDARQAVRNITTKRGTSMRDLSTKVPYTRQQLTRILNGEEHHGDDAIVEIRNAANISLDEYRREIRAVHRAADRAKETES